MYVVFDVENPLASASLYDIQEFPFTVTASPLMLIPLSNVPVGGTVGVGLGVGVDVGLGDGVDVGVGVGVGVGSDTE